jgi:XTP/dITP diphosphohydrolase
MTAAGRRTLLLATRNAGKLRELRALFAGASIDVIDLTAAGVQPSDVEETLERFDTFEENALAKARHFHAASGLPTVADDSGLAVAALGGAPGVRSKRFAGATGDSRTVDAANNARLQAVLAGMTDRAAAFVCAAAYVDDAGASVARGEVRGRVTEAPRGTDGFGYDPYFWSDELGMTFAEASIAEKEAVSHRGRAFRQLVAELAASGKLAAVRR